MLIAPFSVLLVAEQLLYYKTWFYLCIWLQNENSCLTVLLLDLL